MRLLLLLLTLGCAELPHPAPPEASAHARAEALGGFVTRTEFAELETVVADLANELDDQGAVLDVLQEQMDALEGWSPAAWNHTDYRPTDSPLAQFDLDLEGGLLIVDCSIRVLAEAEFRIAIQNADGSWRAHSDTFGTVGGRVADPTLSYAFDLPDTDTYTLTCDGTADEAILEIRVDVVSLPSFAL